MRLPCSVDCILLNISIYLNRGEEVLPEISRFFGIIITMYFNEHNPPHFRVRYNDPEAQFDITEGAFSKGFLPSKQAR